MIQMFTDCNFIRERYFINKTRKHNVDEIKLILITDT